MIKWEYLVVFIHDSKRAQEQPEMDVFLDADKYTEQLNKYGEAGWELVGFEWTAEGAKAALKRPRPVPTEPRKPRTARKKANL